MPKEIKLTQEKVTIVDDEDYEYLSQFKWYAHKNYCTFYARRNIRLINGKQTLICMHQDIMGSPPTGYEWDHEDGNGLNNRRSNLRHVTHRQNMQNMRNQNSTSQFPGVCWYKEGKKWRATIKIDEKIKHLGYFEDEIDAATAYKDALKTIGEVSVEDL